MSRSISFPTYYTQVVMRSMISQCSDVLEKVEIITKPDSYFTFISDFLFPPVTTSSCRVPIANYFNTAKMFLNYAFYRLRLSSPFFIDYGCECFFINTEKKSINLYTGN